METQSDDPVGGSRSNSNEERAANPSVASLGGEDVVVEAIEESPVMRAVAQVYAPRLAHDSLASSQFGVKPPPSFGMIRPVSGLKQGLSVKKEWKGEVKIPSRWILKNDKLEPVPMDFPLERTHREIHHVDPNEVAARISDALRILSIEAEYDCERAKAKCRTADFVSFRIRLYAGGENNQPVVVEVQRRSGSGYTFMQSCRAILDAAEGVKTCPPSKKRGPPPFACPVGSLKCLQGKAAPGDAAIVTPLEVILPMLSSSKRDANVLGMEKLSLLTDPLKTHPAAALRVCKIVALGDSSFSLRDDVLSFLQNDDFSSEFDTDENNISRGYTEQMRHLALVVISNSLSMTSKDGSLADSLHDQRWYGETLLPVLVDEIKCASSRAHCAYEATCALNSLVESCDLGRRLLLGINCVGVLQAAFEIGMTRNELLANETKRCLASLDCGA